MGSATESMFFYFIAGIKIKNWCQTEEGRLYLLHLFFSKHHIDHHIHLQSFQAHAEAELSHVWLRWRPSSWSRDSSARSQKVAVGRSSDGVCRPWHPFSPRSMWINTTERDRVGERVRQCGTSWSTGGWLFLMTFLSFSKHIIYLPYTVSEMNKTGGMESALWNRLLFLVCRGPSCKWNK